MIQLPLILWLSAIVALNGAATSTSVVIELGEPTFDATMTGSLAPWLIEFYAPWCKPCQAFSDTYEQLATELLNKVNIAKVDASAVPNRDLGRRFDIDAFPAFKLLYQGRTFTYQGPHTLEDLRAFVNGGYKLYDSAPTPAPLTFLGLLKKVYDHAFKAGWDDMREGQWISVNIFVSIMPFFIVLVIIIGCILPEPKWEPPTEKLQKRVEEEEEEEEEKEQGAESEREASSMKLH